jgi:hypothetical protein
MRELYFACAAARTRPCRRLALSILAGLCLVSVGCGAGPRPAQISSLAPIGGGGQRDSVGDVRGLSTGSSFRFFSPSSFWYGSVASAQVDPSSDEIVGALNGLVAEEESAKTGPWINTSEFSVPVYTVAADQPTTTVHLSRHVPEPALQIAWKDVPLPAMARPAYGHDALLVVWQPSRDRLWEFWHLKSKAGKWTAQWGGAMRHVSANQGVYGPNAWPGAKSWWGASASSLSLLGGLITLDDLKRGEIDHALSMSIPDVRAGVFASPARRTDGRSVSPLSLPEGAHLRLDQTLDVASLHLPRLTSMIAEAAQRYGIFIRDGSTNVTFQAQDPTPTGTNPYTGSQGYFEGSRPRELLAVFPWNKLELLKMALHKSARYRPGAVRRPG